MNEIVHPKGKLYYSMGEVCEIFDVKPSLIRFWEDNFSVLKPHRNNKGNRLFTPADVDNIGLIYNLVKERGMTLAGAEKKIKQDKKGKNKLNRNVAIIQYLQKIRNLLHEVKDDIDNDDSVVATFDDDVLAEPQDTVEEQDSAAESVTVNEVVAGVDSAETEEKSIQATPDLLAIVKHYDLSELKTESVKKADKKDVDVERQAVDSLSNNQKKTKRNGVTKTPHKTKMTIVEPCLNLFSMVDVTEVQEQSAETDSIEKEVYYTEVPRDVEIGTEKQVEDSEKQSDATSQHEDKAKIETLEVVQTPQCDVKNESEVLKKAQEKDTLTEAQKQKQITQIFF